MNQQFLFAHGAVAPVDPGVSVRLENGALRSRDVDESHTHVVELARPFTEMGGSHHFVGVVERNAQLLRAYLDGNPSGFVDASDPAASNVDISALGSIDTTTAKYLGGSQQLSSFVGSIDTLRVYRRAVSAEESTNLDASR